MLRLTLLPCAALCLAMAVSCGPNLRHVQARSVTEAELLRTEVAGKNIKDESIAAADNYLSLAKTASGINALNHADLAAAHYRAALARHSLEASRALLSRTETALAASEEQVRKYEKILMEISAGKGE